MSSFRHTLNLPKTNFAMRANAVKREPQLYNRTVRDLYKWQAATRQGRPR